MTDLNPCPCCGYLVFSEATGSYDIFPICFWEDDGLQLAYPMMEGGANKKSLFQCQQNFILYGASDQRFIGNIRKPAPNELRAIGWRAFNPNTDPHLDENLPEDDERWKNTSQETNIYYWHPGYWLSPNGQQPENGKSNRSGPIPRLER